MQASSTSSTSPILYHCRMQYLKSREGGARKQQRRKSSMDLFMSESDEPQFSCLDEKVHGPCAPEILVPPSELMTRTLAFRQAYWRHHCKPTVRSIEKLEIHQLDERKERLNRKRKEILSKIRTKEAHRRQADMRRRAERVLNRHSNSGIESDESGDDSESDELDEQLGRMSLICPPQSSSDDKSGSSSPGRRKMMRPSIAIMPKGDARRNRRTIIGGAGGQPQALEDSQEDEFAFSFLSDWGKDKTKIRW